MRTIITTPRFYVREFSPEEENLYLTLYTDTVVTYFINERSTIERKKRFTEGLALYQNGEGFGHWAIINTDDNDFIGVCRLELVAGFPHRAEVGYVFHQKYWGKGLATEMVKSLIEYAFAKTVATEITALTHLPNLSSQRVLEKAGFDRLENVVRDGGERAFFRIGKALQ